MINKEIKIDLPLFIEVASKPNNPDGFPNFYPLILSEDENGHIYQKQTKGLNTLLERIYEYGSTVGNAMDDSPSGKAYTNDFLQFIKKNINKRGSILEVGAGRGYLTKCLKDDGFKVTAIDPGNKQKEYWEKYNVNVINDYFPSSQIKGTFEAIIFYGLLEHISQVDNFLNDINNYLVEDGIIILSVPDCTDELIVGDPTILLHEHIQYFTKETLNNKLKLNNFSVINIENSNFGRAIYVTAKIDKTSRAKNIHYVNLYDDYVIRIDLIRKQIKKNIDKIITNNKTLGIYCPGRGLSILPNYNDIYRFFDDANEFHNKYYPPFDAKIEDRISLLRNPPDTLWILSKTFGEKIKKQIKKYNDNIEIKTIEQLYAEFL